MKEKKIVFIDRDGVINKDPGGWTEHGYVTRWEDFYFIQGSKEALDKLAREGYEIAILSNQAGISKGYYSKEALDDVNGRMLKEIGEASRNIKTYYCLHQDSDNCDCRKPKTGLFGQVEKKLGITAAGNFFIGDNKTDILAGMGAGLKTILVLSGKTSLKMMKEWEIKPDYIVDNLEEAVMFILKGKGPCK